MSRRRSVATRRLLRRRDRRRNAGDHPTRTDHPDLVASHPHRAHRRRDQRPHRRVQPDHQTDQENRLRISQPHQLPAPYPQPHRGHPTAKISSMKGDTPLKIEEPPKSCRPSDYSCTTAREAWRATVGDCKKPSRLERSSNGGKSWKGVTRSGLIPIVGLGIEDRGNLYAVGGARPGCSTRYLAFSASGTIVGQTEAPQGVWYLNPNKRDQVVGPQNAKA